MAARSRRPTRITATTSLPCPIPPWLRGDIGRSRICTQLVEGEVELQHIDRRLTEYAPVALMGCLGDERLDPRDRQVPGSGDPGDLQSGVGRANVGIEPAGGSRDGISRDCGVSGEPVGGAISDHGGLDTVVELLAGRPKVGARGTGGIVARAGGGGTGLEIF